MPKNTTHRVTIRKPNGAASMEVLPVAPPADPIVLPSPEQAVDLLRQLAELNDRVLDAHTKYTDAREKAKTLKGKWEALAEELQALLKASTHAGSTPLFDAAEREADLARMAQGPQSGAGTADGAGSTPEASSGAPGAVGEAF